MPNLAGNIAEGYPMCAADVNDDTDELRVIDGFAEETQDEIRDMKK